MTQEEKNLLLQDLCGRLPYGVRCSNPYGVSTLQSVDLEDMSLTFDGADDNYYELDRNINPYLRPLSSMTEDEYDELKKISSYYGFAPFEDIHNWTPNFNLIDWLNLHHFDYRGLIEKGLALEAPEDMYGN